MSDPRINAYAEAVLAVSLGEGQLSQVEGELFRLGQVFESSDELRNTLNDPHVPVARRQQIVEDLLEGKVSQTTLSLVSMIVGNGRSRARRPVRTRAAHLLLGGPAPGAGSG